MIDFQQRRTMMVDTQVRPNDVTRYPVIAAMLDVPREDFVPDARRDIAYSGENVDLGHGRVLLEPRTLAKMIDALDVQPTDLVLDVGCGLGYSAAVLGRLAQAVVAVEQDAEMGAAAQTRLAASGADNVAVVQAKLTAGAAAQAPYDAILVGGGVEQMPDAIADQLAEGGRIIALWVEGALGTVRLGTRIDGRVVWRFAFHAHAPVLPGFAHQRGFAL
ncbi:protein-L-isoaspartate O-methyltransferase family protein [Paracoccus luteus]|uniref:protein-L-isoaspartate O-methyltransferase family protein n=1 Tax=Paracoccus luteus TaxID=2508543 RepID=UPI00106F84C8|nr:protein-L-isoaspartate O-methyltransferase [Paracoccus luteus]